MRCKNCSNNAVTLKLTMPVPPWSFDPKAPQQVVMEVEEYCPDHLKERYGVILNEDMKVLGGD